MKMHVILAQETRHILRIVLQTAICMAATPHNYANDTLTIIFAAVRE